MGRVKIDRDLSVRLARFTASMGLTDRDVGIILNVESSKGIAWLFEGVVAPAYVVASIERLIAEPRLDDERPSFATEIAVRYGIAERAEDWQYEKGVTLHVGYAVPDQPVPLPVIVLTTLYIDAMRSGEVARWRFLKTYVDGYVAALMQQGKADHRITSPAIERTKELTDTLALVRERLEGARNAPHYADNVLALAIADIDGKIGRSA